jgi:NadR type nicotinamide-nucleotide adenylyltransferase
MANWRFIPPCVRPHFVRRVCLFGPESTGKSVLARRLADHYSTRYAAEYARPMLDLQENRCEYDDISRIARGQIASEEALARQADRLLFCDTDPLTTTVWSRALFGKCPAWLDEEARARRYDLTLLFDVGCPWVEDPTRYYPNQRGAFLDWCKEALGAAGRPYTLVSGNWEERFRRCVELSDELLAQPHSSLGISVR